MLDHLVLLCEVQNIQLNRGSAQELEYAEYAHVLEVTAYFFMSVLVFQ